MSGSNESNDDLVSGRVNRSNDQTTIWAENQYTTTSVLFIETGEFRIDFNGDVILRVEVANDSENDGEFHPPEPLDAIVGVGWREYDGSSKGGTGVTGIGGKVGGLGIHGEGGEDGTGVFADAGGQAAGVISLGGPRQGTGVFGLGSGGERLNRRGAGGIGVHGVGGVGDLRRSPAPPGQPAPPDITPGTGVFGQGGKIVDYNEKRLLLGAGVIGVGGDAGSKDMPSLQDSGSAGVFGQGAEAIIENISGTSTFVGPEEAGPGVVGRGGVAISSDFRLKLPVGAGVIGLAGGQNKPAITETGDTGVFGLGRTGVQGHGIAGPGLIARSDQDRGGVFKSDLSAQIRLVPKKVGTRLPEASVVTPTGISEVALKSGVVSLPKVGQGGDLMTLIDDTRRCTLWFCVQDSSRGQPARWAQVLLGPDFDGQS